jgi:hypothetical protein
MSDYEKLKPALKNLVDSGKLDANQALAAQIAMQASGLASDGRSRKSLFSEALTFVGGAVVFFCSCRFTPQPNLGSARHLG